MADAKVYLVGAGPGDPGLITLRGVEVLGLADVVLYDALVHPDLLDHARPRAERRFVGKRFGQPSISQEAINAMLLELARDGRRVVRLKGGDPLLFARGAEEVETLARAGIPFEIVPGIPSPLGAAAYAGIPLTHRDFSSSVCFVTGTESPGKERSAHDWSKLACAAETLCIVMGMRRLEVVASALMDHGRSLDTPAAVVQWATWAKQRVVTGTLGTIAARAREAGITTPAIIVVGAVAGLRDAMRWFDNRPLSGKRIALFRPREQARDSARAVRQRGAEPVQVPLIQTVAPREKQRFDDAVAAMSQFDVVCFTSANGVRAVFDHLRAHERDARAFGAARVAAIGPATAQALTDEGIRADIVAKEFRGEGLAAGILEQFGSLQGRRILVLRALVARDALPDALRDAGADVHVVAAYESCPVDVSELVAFRNAISRGEIDAVLLTSSSIVEQLAEALGADKAQLLRDVVVASIGPVTTETARRLDIQVDVTASQYTVPGLLDALEQHVMANPRPLVDGR